jgi:putative phosphoesterase
MKLLIIGDSHGNITNLKHVMGFAEKIKADAVIHTGDWNNLECVKVVLSFNIPLYSCLGNADISPEIKRKFKNLLEFNLDGRKIYLIHKFFKNDDNYLGKDVVFTGHYHSQRVRDINGTKIIMPGALEKDINFAVYDTKTNDVELMKL